MSIEKKDPGLRTGWLYFVEDAPYCKYLLTVTDQKEILSCTGLSALDHANTKYNTGLATTGVGIGCCVRHELIELGGVGNLQVGKQ